MQQACTRILKSGVEGWWAIGPRLTAHVPDDGVDPTSHRFTPEAGVELDRAGFFDRRADVYAVTLLSDTACNLGCNYCFQNLEPARPGLLAPDRITRHSLTSAVLQQATRFVGQMMAAQGKSQVDLLLFGGEPLMNVDGCKAALSSFQPLGLKLGRIITNGVLLTAERAEELRVLGLREVQVTFDGSRSDHDAVRYYRSGRPTYRKILSNLAQVGNQVAPLTWKLRVNVSHHNIDRLDRLIQDLSTVRADSHDYYLDLALIDDTGIGYENAVGYDDRTCNRFVKIYAEAIDAGFHVRPSGRISDCPYCSQEAGKSSGAVINADGRLYSCWENAGRTGWDVGNVWSGYMRASGERWVACDFEIKPHAEPRAAQHFKDRIDVANLDRQFLRPRNSVSSLGGATGNDRRTTTTNASQPDV